MGKKKEVTKQVGEQVKEEKPITLDETPIEAITPKQEVKQITPNENIIPAGFSPIPPKPNKSGLGLVNGRPYKEIGKGIGMFCDTGDTFVIER